MARSARQKRGSTGRRRPQGKRDDGSRADGQCRNSARRDHRGGE
jgi:hypothetical protein